MVSIFSLLLAATTIWFVLRPIIEPGELSAVDVRSPDLQSLIDQKARCVQVLKDLDLDFSLLKLSEAEYQLSKVALTRELAGVMTRIEVGIGKISEK